MQRGRASRPGVLQLARATGKHIFVTVGLLGTWLWAPGALAGRPEAGMDVGSAPAVLCRSASTYNTYDVVCAASPTALEAPAEMLGAVVFVICEVPPASSLACVVPMGEPLLGTTVDYVWCYLAEQPPLNWLACV